jgi:xylulokinase
VTALTLDLGTSATKAALWSGTELVGLARVTIPTSHSKPGYAEQDPEHWWQSVVDACATLRLAAPAEYAGIDICGCSAARETFACFDAQLKPLSPGILWSDARGGDQLTSLGDPAIFRRRTGVILSDGCQAAKVAWVRQHEPGWFERSRWLLAPRDFVLARLTGQVLTEPTLASRTGFYTIDGDLIGDAAIAERLPPIVASVRPVPVSNGHALMLSSDTSAILGAGDRACEALGVGATAAAPSVSWGTTVNVSVPHPGPFDASIAQISRGAASGFLIEAGLSTGGSALEWLGTLTSRPVNALLTAAADVPPGANGVLAFPWLHGARAPWWRPGTRASFTGVTAAHGPADLARALIEGIALDAARSVQLVAPGASTVFLTGAGAENPLWRSVLGAAIEAAVTVRTHADAATVGARALTILAKGDDPDVETLNPVRVVEQPQPELVQQYRALRTASDRVARALLDSGSP